MSKKSVENEAVPGFSLPGGGTDGVSRAAGVARDRKYEENASTEAAGCTIDAGQEAKVEILVNNY